MRCFLKGIGILDQLGIGSNAIMINFMVLCRLTITQFLCYIYMQWCADELIGSDTFVTSNDEF